VFGRSETMPDSDVFIVVDSVNNFDDVLKREKRYLSLRCRFHHRYCM